MEKVLIIDDNPTDRIVQQKMLEQQYDVKVSASPFDAKDIITDWNPDVIVIDYAMPRINGIQAIKYLKEKTSYKGIFLILTGLDDVNIATEAIRQGAYDYLVKPLVPEIFNHKIKNCSKYSELLNGRNEEISSVTVERVILAIFHELKPHLDQIVSLRDKVCACSGVNNDEIDAFKEHLAYLNDFVSKLGELNQSSQKEYAENILAHYLK